MTKERTRKISEDGTAEDGSRASLVQDAEDGVMEMIFPGNHSSEGWDESNRTNQQNEDDAEEKKGEDYGINTELHNQPATRANQKSLSRRAGEYPTVTTGDKTASVPVLGDAEIPKPKSVSTRAAEYATITGTGDEPVPQQNLHHTRNEGVGDPTARTAIEDVLYSNECVTGPDSIPSSWGQAVQREEQTGRTYGLAMMPMARQTRHSVPGAYLATGQADLQLLDHASFSAVGLALGTENQEQSHGETNGAPAGLVVATPVDEAEMPDMQALPFDIDASRRTSTGQQKMLRMQFLQVVALFFCLVLSGGGIILGVVLKQGGEDSAHPFSSTAPSVIPSDAPSSAPTGFLEVFLPSLPEYTLNSLRNISTPQWEAIAWLSNHPELLDMQEWRMKQLFALATFFFSMEGSEWPHYIRDNWLVYDKSECLWFSSEFGNFVAGGYKEAPTYRMTPCTQDGKLQMLILAEMHLEGTKPLIPPEIALLTSLSALALPLIGINGSLNEFLPSQIYQMTSLTSLRLIGNQFTGSLSSNFASFPSIEELTLGDNLLSGPIPSELALMTSMTELNLGVNSLTGILPTELAMLPSIKRLDLGGNVLSGPIPSELGLTTSFTRLSLHHNTISGSIPSQLGVLTNQDILPLQENLLEGTIPSELWSLQQLKALHINSNSLSGTLSTQLGLMKNMKELSLEVNSFSGSIPSELGLLSQLRKASFYNNTFFGLIPSELGQLSELEFASFQQNSLTGSIPLQLGMLALNESLELLTIADNDLTGLVPEDLCSMGLFNADNWVGLSFDCNDRLCGCEWCVCR